MSDGIQDSPNIDRREVPAIRVNPPVEIIPEEKPLRDWETCAIGQIPIKEKIGVGILNPSPVQQARDIVEKMAWRIVQQTPQQREENEAAKSAGRKPNQVVTVEAPVINQVRVFNDGNLTIAILNDEVIGWSKFNPNDVLLIKGKSKKGKTWYQNRTKYSPEAGRMKAIHRAVEKLVDKKKNGSTGQTGQ